MQPKMNLEVFKNTPSHSVSSPTLSNTPSLPKSHKNVQFCHCITPPPLHCHPPRPLTSPSHQSQHISTGQMTQKACYYTPETKKGIFPVFQVALKGHLTPYRSKTTIIEPVINIGYGISTHPHLFGITSQQHLTPPYPCLHP